MGLSVRGTHTVGASDLLVRVRLLERGRRDALRVFLVGDGVFGVSCGGFVRGHARLVMCDVAVG